MSRGVGSIIEVQIMRFWVGNFNFFKNSIAFESLTLQQTMVKMQLDINLEGKFNLNYQSVEKTALSSVCKGKRLAAYLTRPVQFTQSMKSFLTVAD